MSGADDDLTRRGFLAAAAGVAVASGNVAARAAGAAPVDGVSSAAESFWGVHQSGIATAPQACTYFAALDLQTKNAADVVALMQTWTMAAARMMRGEPAQPIGADLSIPADSGEALELGPRRLTLTFGFGRGLFEKDGQDR